MLYSISADIIVLIHLAFVGFVVLGAVVIIWRRWVAWLHLPAVFWAIWTELTGGVCPLTPLENWLRNRAEQGGYRGDFVEHYLLPLLYPDGLTPNIQILLGLGVISINAALYGYIFFQYRRRK